VAARYALSTFVVQLSTGGSQLVVEGALRDSTHQAVVDHPTLFSSSPVTPKSVHLLSYLAAYPAGP
jgi:hypothetical protein